MKHCYSSFTYSRKTAKFQTYDVQILVLLEKSQAPIFTIMLQTLHKNIS